LVAFGLSVTGCTGASENAKPSPAEASSPLDGRIQIGLYYGDQSLTATNEELGTTPALHLTYFDWGSDWSADPMLQSDAARGQTSLVNWEPFGADFHDILDGHYDELITKQALGVAALSQPVMLDFAAEMNEEEGWGDHDPELYIAVWHHVHDIFAAHAEGNVHWVWAPNNTDSADAPPAMAYYPGDDYVDWTGMDGYNWGTSDPDFHWQPFAEVFGDLYDDLHTIGKPIIIGETASATEGGDKAEWISDILPTLTTRFPDIKALVWFDIAKERDWRLHSSPEVFDAFKDLANNPNVESASA
jgi:hypothetical protein